MNMQSQEKRYQKKNTSILIFTPIRSLIDNDSMFSVETEEILVPNSPKDDVWSSVIISAPDRTVTWGERGRGLNFSGTICLYLFLQNNYI